HVWAETVIVLSTNTKNAIIIKTKGFFILPLGNS
ncbi:unnamed protein product, partial [marine sediment metagenome]